VVQLTASLLTRLATGVNKQTTSIIVARIRSDVLLVRVEPQKLVLSVTPGSHRERVEKGRK